MGDAYMGHNIDNLLLIKLNGVLYLFQNSFVFTEQLEINTVSLFIPNTVSLLFNSQHGTFITINESILYIIIHQHPQLIRCPFFT